MRRTFFHRIVLSAVVFLFVNSSSFSQNGTITGRVQYGKEVLQAATVSLGNKTVFTNYNGEFSFSVQAGNYTLVITHAGYKKVEKKITVKGDRTISFEFEMIPNEQLGEIVVLGSRSNIHRSNLNTAVPVDAFSSTELMQTGQTSLMQMLNFVAPSLRASLQFFIEPITLRGLDPDHTLILLNGSRYGNIAYINRGNPGGALGRGSAGNDLNTIPFSAIEKIEILRDGATAQFGSDATAGVINILLKESTGKTSVNLHLGQQYKGDGENISLGIYHGIDLNKKARLNGSVGQGFLSFSGDMRFRFPTFRAGEYTGTVYKNYPPHATHDDSIRIKLSDDSTIQARGFDRKNAGNSGTTKLTSFGFLMNGAYRIKDNMELFWTGAMNNLTLVFVNQYVNPKTTMWVDTLLFPDGYKSRVRINTWNVSAIAGAKGKIGNEIHWQ